MKIRSLNITDIIKLKKLTSHLNSGDLFYNKSELLFNPLSFINRFLPAKLKFMNDSFVEIDGGNISGMISLRPRKNNPKKWIINKLLLNEDSLDSGERLINYVVEKYAMKGAENFEVNINSDNQAIIDLFSKACDFRYCLERKIYEIKTCYYKNKGVNTGNYIFRPFKNEDKDELAELYNQNISPYYKFPLSKIPDEYKEPFFKGLNNYCSFIYIFEEKFSKKIKGYLKIETEDNKCFVSEIVLVQSYEEYFEDIITFTISQISKRATTYTLYFKNLKFHLNSEIFENKLSEIDNELKRTDMVFVKDFFRQVKDMEEVKNNSVIYNEINGKPAYKI